MDGFGMHWQQNLENLLRDWSRGVRCGSLIKSYSGRACSAWDPNWTIEVNNVFSAQLPCPGLSRVDLEEGGWEATATAHDTGVKPILKEDFLLLGPGSKACYL